VVNVILGARNEAQLMDNLAAADFTLTAEQVARLDAASAVTRIYPYWHQVGEYKDRNPPPTT
jgi:aryl-alcohol dehydrogenase-like predicted oxidoreductase